MEKASLKLPFAAQVLILVLAAIIIAQLITIFAVDLAPVQPPPRYSVKDLTLAFRGVDTDNARHRKLSHRIVAALPAELVTGNDPQLASYLAGAMGAPASSLRIHGRGPAAMVGATSGRSQLFGHPPAPHPLAETGPGGPRGPLHDWQMSPAGPATASLGEFIAARQMPDGRWLVVEPRPEMEWVRRVCIWIGGGMLILGPLAWLFANRITRPLRRFAEAAERLGRDPTSAPVAVEGPAEIGLAATAFNRMQTQIQRYVSDRVGMVGAISHDLRTPLTRIRFKVENVNPTVRDAVLRDVHQMEHMISAVLDFIRDASQDATRETLDLVSLISCSVDDRAATDADIAFEGEDQSLLIDGNPVQLRRLFDNLIDNAIKFGGEAHIKLTLKGGEAVATIRDNGPGLPPEDLEKVFAPFYRGVGTSGIQGTGLGLAIARSIARAHGGDVALFNADNGLIAQVILPVDSQ